ncbi:MAG: RHS repeat-associated core domain-containing protein [Chloroflexota bacterium]
MTFPSLFQANDGGTLPGDGSPTLSLTYVYTVTGSTYAGDGRIVSVSDRAGNTFSVPGSDPRHFVVYYDPAAPQFDSVSIELDPGSANTNLYIDQQTLYYGPLSGGRIIIRVGAHDTANTPAGIKHVEFPALFGALSLQVVETNQNLYGRTYTIDGSAHEDDGPITLVAVDNVGNRAQNASLSVRKDADTPTISLDVTQRLDSFDLAWDVQDVGAGVDTDTLTVSYCDVVGAGCQAIAIAPAAQGSATFSGDDLGYTFRVTAADRVGNTGATTTRAYSTATITKYYALGSQRVALRKVNASGSQSAVYFLYGDHLGSTSLMTDEGGAIVSQARNLPFGETRWGGMSLTDFTFTGQRDDGFGLMDYNARYYSSRLGRFASADTVIPGAGDAANFDRFAYVRSNPVRHRDPSGHCIDSSTGNVKPDEAPFGTSGTCPNSAEKPNNHHNQHNDPPELANNEKEVMNTCGPSSACAASEALGVMSYDDCMQKFVTWAGNNSALWSSNSGIQPSTLVKFMNDELGMSVTVFNFSSNTPPEVAWLILSGYSNNGNSQVIVDYLSSNDVEDGQPISSDEGPTFAHFARVQGVTDNKITLANSLSDNPLTVSPKDTFLASWNNPERNAAYGRSHPEAVEKVFYWFIVLTKP